MISTLSPPADSHVTMLASRSAWRVPLSLRLVHVRWRYAPTEIEGRWQGKWEARASEEPSSASSGKKFYILSMFPYPSGRLHMGHVRVYTISDCLAHFHRMRGRRVLHPMGWDAFGLPAENAAIERGLEPARWTGDNIDYMRGQLKRLGCHFDWSREVTTCKAEYYRWTQWMFLQLFHRGLAYRQQALVNWDPVDQTVLANEQIDECGRSWRSGAVVEQRLLNQWFLRITHYAEGLLEGLSELEWPQGIKTMQEEWIGRSAGAYFDFSLEDRRGETVRVFTTRPETVFGASYIAVATNHKLVSQLQEDSGVTAAVANLCAGAEEGPRGVLLPVRACHPFWGTSLPVFVTNYVVSGYGTGAVMGVQGHDQRDREFAASVGLPTSDSVVVEDDCGGDAGVLVGSGQFSGLPTSEGRAAILDHAKSAGVGGSMVTYRLRDWLVSRQRYWGAPIPVVACSSCGDVPVAEGDLPVVLPTDVTLTGKGRSPLATNKQWREAKCPRCGGAAERETDTMDTFVDSSWYFLRYADPHNARELVTKQLAKQWMPVDIYIGGIEHAILHLLYARFITHFLWDLGLVPEKEPFKRLLAQGMVQGKTYCAMGSGRYLQPEEVEVCGGVAVDKATGEKVKESWEKMSKSKHNGVDPEDIIERVGADTVRLFVLFKAPPEADILWDTKAIQGVHRWLNRLDRLTQQHLRAVPRRGEGRGITLATNKAIKEVTEMMERRHSFNVAVAALMTLSNVLHDCSSSMAGSAEYHVALSTLSLLLAPMAPHMASEMWSELAKVRGVLELEPVQGDALEQPWPVCGGLQDDALTVQVVLQVNGVKQLSLEVPATTAEDALALEEFLLQRALDQELLQSPPLRVVIAPNNRLINFVTK